ncbi:hypothetical protein GCM10010193_57530 [Kitasatospora atroaurantiaca]|uniref:Large ribosomal subunit protein uL23 n=1 Tax=Kitasatospora atroaurantiaca TaxID=285545 RepID=A0A561EMZ8_9ACTN|nr:ribosomal protein L23 [Kitasatospora atroaurantiaca]
MAAEITSKTFMDPRDVLIKPVISEKSYSLLDENKYTFVVSPGANKTQIKQAVEAVFSVKVEAVNTLNRRGKRKRSKTGFGKRMDTKRAIVTLAEGNRIDIFGGPVSAGPSPSAKAVAAVGELEGRIEIEESTMPATLKKQSLTPRTTAYSSKKSDGDFVSVGRFEDCYSFLWSTSYGTELIAHIIDQTIIGEARVRPSSAIVLLVGADEHRQLNPETLLDLTKKNPESILFARLNFPRLAITWETSRHLEGGGRIPSQLGIIAEAFDASSLKSLLFRTGTKAISQFAELITDDAAKLLQRFPRVRLLNTEGWFT